MNNIFYSFITISEWHIQWVKPSVLNMATRQPTTYISWKSTLYYKHLQKKNKRSIFFYSSTSCAREETKIYRTCSTKIKTNRYQNELKKTSMLYQIQILKNTQEYKRDFSSHTVRRHINFIWKFTDVNFKPILHIIQYFSICFVRNKGHSKSFGAKSSSTSNL